MADTDTVMVAVRILLVISLMLLELCACQRQKSLPLKGTDITGAKFGGDFALIDHHGRQRTLQGFKGKVVGLFFGYTHCPDVCPSTMLEYANAMKLLGDKADNIQVLFVSVDPERDTLNVLANYVPYFDKRFLGLTGSVEEVAEVLERFKVVANRVPVAHGEYVVDHSAGSYLFDSRGRLRVYEPYATPAASLAHDIEVLLQ